MAMVSAIQEAQKDNVRSFNDYMLKVLEVSIVTTFFFNLISMLLYPFNQYSLMVVEYFLLASCFFS